MGQAGAENRGLGARAWCQAVFQGPGVQRTKRGLPSPSGAYYVLEGKTDSASVRVLGREVTSRMNGTVR